MAATFLTVEVCTPPQFCKAPFTEHIIYEGRDKLESGPVCKCDKENMSFRTGMSSSVHVQQYSGEFEGVLLTTSFGTQTTGHGGFNGFKKLKAKNIICSSGCMLNGLKSFVVTRLTLFPLETNVSNKLNIQPPNQYCIRSLPRV